MGNWACMLCLVIVNLATARACSSLGLVLVNCLPEKKVVVHFHVAAAQYKNGMMSFVNMFPSARFWHTSQVDFFNHPWENLQV